MQIDTPKSLMNIILKLLEIDKKQKAIKNYFLKD